MIQLLIILNLSVYSPPIGDKPNQINVDSIIHVTQLLKTEIEHDLLEVDQKILDINNKLSEISYFKNNVSLGFWLGLLGTLVASFFTLYWATREVVYQKLSRLTGIEKAIIKRNLQEFNKHNFLRKNIKILVISKDGKFSPNFKKLMKSFGVDLSYDNSSIIIEDIHNYDFEKLIMELQKNEIILIENKFKEVWNLKDVDKQIFVNIANRICDRVSIVYFGDYFPKIDDGINEDKMDNISFANASSQLYSNLLNMIKYRNEMGIKIKKDKTS